MGDQGLVVLVQLCDANTPEQPDPLLLGLEELKSWRHIETLIRQMYSDPPEGVRVCYLDDENDWVELSCDAELAEAVSVTYAHQEILQLQVRRVDGEKLISLDNTEPLVIADSKTSSDSQSIGYIPSASPLDELRPLVYPYPTHQPEQQPDNEELPALVYPHKVPNFPQPAEDKDMAVQKAAEADLLGDEIYQEDVKRVSSLPNWEEADKLSKEEKLHQLKMWLNNSPLVNEQRRQSRKAKTVTKENSHQGSGDASKVEPLCTEPGSLGQYFYPNQNPFCFDLDPYEPQEPAEAEVDEDSSLTEDDQSDLLPEARTGTAQFKKPMKKPRTTLKSRAFEPPVLRPHALYDGAIPYQHEIVRQGSRPTSQTVDEVYASKQQQKLCVCGHSPMASTCPAPESEEDQDRHSSAVPQPSATEEVGTSQPVPEPRNMLQMMAGAQSGANAVAIEIPPDYSHNSAMKKEELNTFSRFSTASASEETGEVQNRDNTVCDQWKETQQLSESPMTHLNNWRSGLSDVEHMKKKSKHSGQKHEKHTHKSHGSHGKPDKHERKRTKSQEQSPKEHSKKSHEKKERKREKENVTEDVESGEKIKAKYASALQTRDFVKYMKKMKKDLRANIVEDIVQEFDALISRLAQRYQGAFPMFDELTTIPTIVPEKEYHDGIFCDSCNQDIYGIRYKCGNCEDFDLCEVCEGRPDVHDPEHVFLKIKHPLRNAGCHRDAKYKLLRENLYETEPKKPVTFRLRLDKYQCSPSVRNWDYALKFSPWEIRESLFNQTYEDPENDRYRIVKAGTPIEKFLLRNYIRNLPHEDCPSRMLNVLKGYTEEMENGYLLGPNSPSQKGGQPNSCASCHQWERKERGTLVTIKQDFGFVAPAQEEDDHVFRFLFNAEKAVYKHVTVVSLKAVTDVELDTPDIDLPEEAESVAEHPENLRVANDSEEEDDDGEGDEVVSDGGNSETSDDFCILEPMSSCHRHENMSGHASPRHEDYEVIHEGSPHERSLTEQVISHESSQDIETDGEVPESQQKSEAEREMALSSPLRGEYEIVTYESLHSPEKVFCREGFEVVMMGNSPVKMEGASMIGDLSDVMVELGDHSVEPDTGSRAPEHAEKDALADTHSTDDQASVSDSESSDAEYVKMDKEEDEDSGTEIVEVEAEEGQVQEGRTEEVEEEKKEAEQEVVEQAEACAAAECQMSKDSIDGLVHSMNEEEKMRFSQLLRTEMDKEYEAEHRRRAQKLDEELKAQKEREFQMILEAKEKEAVLENEKLAQQAKQEEERHSSLSRQTSVTSVCTDSSYIPTESEGAVGGSVASGKRDVDCQTNPEPVIQASHIIHNVASGVSRAASTAFSTAKDVFYSLQAKQNEWKTPSSNYKPPQSNWKPPANNWTPPTSTWNPPKDNYIPPTSKWTPPKDDYVPPTSEWTPSNAEYIPPTSDYIPPKDTFVPPTSNWTPPEDKYVPPTSNWTPRKDDYVPPTSNWVPPKDEYIPPTSKWTPPAQSNLIYPNVEWITKPAQKKSKKAETVKTASHGAKEAGKNGSHSTKEGAKKTSIPAQSETTPNTTANASAPSAPTTRRSSSSSVASSGVPTLASLEIADSALRREVMGMQRLIEMGFANRDYNRALLNQFDNDLEKVVQTLLQEEGQADEHWSDHRY